MGGAERDQWQDLKFKSEYTAIDFSHTAYLSCTPHPTHTCTVVLYSLLVPPLLFILQLIQFSHTQFEKWLQSCSLTCARGILCHRVAVDVYTHSLIWVLGLRFIDKFADYSHRSSSSSLLCALHGVEKESGALWGIRAASIAVALRSPRCWSGADTWQCSTVRSPWCWNEALRISSALRALALLLLSLPTVHGCESASKVVIKWSAKTHVWYFDHSAVEVHSAHEHKRGVAAS